MWRRYWAAGLIKSLLKKAAGFDAKTCRPCLRRMMFSRLSSSLRPVRLLRHASSLPRKKVTAMELLRMRRASEVRHAQETHGDARFVTRARTQRIAMVTAYDYPSAVHVELAGIHVLLCGDLHRCKTS